MILTPATEVSRRCKAEYEGRRSSPLGRTGVHVPAASCFILEPVVGT
jgi:hypothetical protein